MVSNVKSALKKIANNDGAIFSSQSKVGKFLERYIVCEAIIRAIIEHNIKRKCPQNLHILQINSSIKKVSNIYSIHPELIKSIFESGVGIRNKKTPRQLRNKIIHSLTKEDCSEVESRFVDLMVLMQKLIDKFI